MQQARSQQDQARQQQEQEMKQAGQARQQQEQTLRQQEQQSHKAQEDAQKAQQEQVRAQQEQGREQQQQQARGQQEQQARGQQEQQARGQQEQAREQQQQQQQVRAQQDQAREQQQHTAMTERAPGGRGEQPGAVANEHGARPGAFASDRAGNAVLTRAAAPPQITASRLALSKAIAMPVLAQNARPEDREHLQEVQRNLQDHMFAVAAADAPSNFHSMPNLARQAYFNNYQATIANQQFIINQQNTYINALAQSQWPTWYQAQPNYQFCNGFTLGDTIKCDLNWLRWGWHPYYGPEPDGFVAARNYFPTPWIFLPAYGTWRQPGVNAYAAYGPPYDYTGPISVEVFEPRHVNVDQPFGGWLPQQVINAVYFYNAFYYPEFGRYGYMNRHNNWIWLNLGTQPF
jgi:hypothetical protein